MCELTLIVRPSHFDPDQNPQGQAMVISPTSFWP